MPEWWVIVRVYEARDEMDAKRTAEAVLGADAESDSITVLRRPQSFEGDS